MHECGGRGVWKVPRGFEANQFVAWCPLKVLPNPVNRFYARAVAVFLSANSNRSIGPFRK